MTTCGDHGGVKKNGEPCAIVTKDGRCGLHEEGVDLREKLLTPDEIEKVERMAEIALTQDEVAHIIGIAPNTFRARMKDQEGVAAAYKSGLDKGHAFVKGQLRKLIKGEKPNPAAVFFYLKTQCGWRETFEVTGKDGGPIRHAMTPEEKTNRIAGLLNGAHARSNGA